MSAETLRWMLYLAAALSLALSGLVRRPGIGVILTLGGIAILVGILPQTLMQFGFAIPSNWPFTLGLGVLLGVAIALLALALIEPLAEWITGQEHDISIVAGIRGNLPRLLLWLVVVWVFVGLLEELIFRGYLVTEMLHLLGDSTTAALVGLVLSSLVFGLSHAYQGPSGAISAGILGLIIGAIFLASNLNLWLAIVIHASIDTVQLILISLGMDGAIRRRFIPGAGNLPGQPSGTDSQPD